MTILTTARSQPFQGNGVATAFPCSFPIFQDTDVAVSYVNPTTGTTTPLALNTDYTVSGEGGSGFTVTTTVPVPSGTNLLVAGNLPYTQPTNFTDQGNYYPSMLQTVADRTEMQIQQLAGAISRTLMMPDGLIPAANTALPIPLANSLLGWGQVGGIWQLLNVGASGVGAGSILTANLADGSVTSPKLANGAVGTAQLADAGVTMAKLDADVTSAISDGTSYTQSGTGGVAQMLSAFAASFVTPEQFGCVGDGTTDDTTKLQNALTRAAGGILRLTPGKTYLVTASLLVSSKTTIIGYGATIKRGSTIGNMLHNNADGVTGLYAANTNITILGGTFDPNIGAWPQQSTSVAFGHCTDITVRDVTFLEAPVWHGLELNACQRAHVDNCVFIGGAAQAVLEEQLQIDLMASSSAFPWFGPYDNTPCLDVRVTDCNFSTGGIGVGSHTSVAGVSHQNIWISNCHFTNPYYTGVEMLNWTGVKITDCRFDGGYYGVVSDVTENRSDYAVRGCTFFNVGNTAYASVSNNNAQAIRFNNTATHRIVGIEGCFVGNHNLTYSLHAIVVLQGEDVRIRGNVVRDVNGTGIWAAGGATVIIEGNRAHSTNLAAGGYYGINLGDTAGASDCVVSGNVANTINIKSVTHGLCTGNTVTTASGITSATNTGTTIVNNLVNGTYA